MTWQQGPPESSPAAPEGEGPDADEVRGTAVLPARRAGRGSRQLAALVILLATGLGGLAVAAIGIAHQLLPRQFTHRQQSQIATWEMERRWRVLPAGKIFPDQVSYQLSALALDANAGLMLDARRLGIARQSGCAAAVSGSAVAILARYGCTEALRATYVDSSGSMVATIAIMVLTGPAVARTAAADLSRQPSGTLLVRTFPVKGTPAAGFGDAERQLSRATADGPYVVLSTAGFADARHRIAVREDSYLDQEMTSLNAGLTSSAAVALGHTPAPPVCPGTPGC